MHAAPLPFYSSTSAMHADVVLTITLPKHMSIGECVSRGHAQSSISTALEGLVTFHPTHRTHRKLWISSYSMTTAAHLQTGVPHKTFVVMRPNVRPPFFACRIHGPVSSPRRTSTFHRMSGPFVIVDPARGTPEFGTRHPVIEGSFDRAPSNANAPTRNISMHNRPSFHHPSF